MILMLKKRHVLICYPECGDLRVENIQRGIWNKKIGEFGNIQSMNFLFDGGSGLRDSWSDLSNKFYFALSLFVGLVLIEGS